MSRFAVAAIGLGLEPAESDRGDGCRNNRAVAELVLSNSPQARHKAAGRTDIPSDILPGGPLYDQGREGSGHGRAPGTAGRHVADGQPVADRRGKLDGTPFVGRCPPVCPVWKPTWPRPRPPYGGNRSAGPRPAVRWGLLPG